MPARAPLALLVAAALALGACSGDDAGAEPIAPPTAEIEADLTLLVRVDSPSGEKSAVHFRAQGGGAAGWVASDIWIGESGGWRDGTSTYTPHMNERRWGFLCNVRFGWDDDTRLTVTYGIVASYLGDDGLPRPQMPVTPGEIAGVSMAYEFDPTGC